MAVFSSILNFTSTHHAEMITAVRAFVVLVLGLSIAEERGRHDSVGLAPVGEKEWRDELSLAWARFSVVAQSDVPLILKILFAMRLRDALTDEGVKPPSHQVLKGLLSAAQPFLSIADRSGMSLPVVDRSRNYTLDNLHIAVNSVVGYEEPRSRLIDSLVNGSGVPPERITVFVGGSQDYRTDTDWRGVRFRFVTHNSIDFTALIAILEDAVFVTRDWFYLHDTCSVSENFPSLSATAACMGHLT